MSLPGTPSGEADLAVPVTNTNCLETHEMAPTTQSSTMLPTEEPKSEGEPNNKKAPIEGHEPKHDEKPKHAGEPTHVEEPKYVKEPKYVEELRLFGKLKRGKNRRDPTRTAGVESSKPRIPHTIAKKTQVKSTRDRKEETRSYKGRGAATWPTCDVCKTKVEYVGSDDSFLCPYCGIPRSMS